MDTLSLLILDLQNSSRVKKTKEGSKHTSKEEVIAKTSVFLRRPTQVHRHRKTRTTNELNLFKTQRRLRKKLRLKRIDKKFTSKVWMNSVAILRPWCLNGKLLIKLSLFVGLLNICRQRCLTSKVTICSQIGGRSALSYSNWPQEIRLFKTLI